MANHKDHKDLDQKGREDQIKGKMEKGKGAVKDAAGKAIDDRSMQAEGKWEKAKGAAREKVGDIKRDLDSHRKE